MKALLAALFALIAPSAHAQIDCTYEEYLVGEGKTFVTAPMLVLGGETPRYARFIAPNYREANFASNLCKLCRLGNHATAISYEGVSPGSATYAMFDSSGQLSRVGKIDAISNAVDSLTCAP